MTEELKNLKKISVVMATYNGEKYIREQLDSILLQTYPVYELIIQDDGSTDSTVKIIKEYADRNEYIHFYQNEHNLGFRENFKTATMRATGDYIALADQDDVWYPQKLEKQIDAIGNNDMCYSMHHRGPDMQHTHIVSYQCAPERQLFAAIVGHSMLMRREYAQNANNWLDYMPTHDISLSIMAHFSNGVVCVEEPLNWHRNHNASASNPVNTIVKNKSKEWGLDFCKPYIYGYKYLRRIQTTIAFKKYYTEIARRSENKNPLVHNICRLMLKKDFTSLIKLCYICLKHRKTIYPAKTHGLSGIIRGFCYPLIYAYHNDYFIR